MSLKDIKVFHNKRIVNLPIWINFAFHIGSFIHEYSKKHKYTNIIISLPSDQYFPLFIAMGIADKTFSMRKQMRSIRKTILNLTPGTRIIYQDEKSSRKASVIGLEPSPVFENEMILKIKDGKIELGIPERQWIDRVILLDEEFDEIKRTRKVSKNQKVGIDSPILEKLYTANQLNNTSFYPGDEFYLVGNLTEYEDLMEEEIFTCNGVFGSISDFLYVDNKNSYTNGKLFSAQLKKLETEILEDVPVIFGNINSYLKQVKYFPTNPKIIISSRTDNEGRIHELQEEIKRQLLQEEYQPITDEIVEYITDNEVQIPNGIEFFAWR